MTSRTPLPLKSPPKPGIPPRVNGKANGEAKHYNRGDGTGHTRDFAYGKKREFTETSMRSHPDIYDWMQEEIQAKSEQLTKDAKPERGTVYRDKIFPRIAFQLRLLGASDQMMADAFGVSLDTINVWKLEHENFATALRYGGDMADARVAESLFHRAVGYSHPAVKIFYTPEGIVEAEHMRHYAPDTGAATVWLTNRQKNMWRNRTTNEITGVDGQPLTPPQLIINPVKSNGNGGVHE